MTIDHIETEHATIDNSFRVAIRAKYLGPGNVTGSRWRVWRSDTTYREDPDAITVPYDHALNGSGNAIAAVAQYLDNKGDGWAGRWVLAGADDSSYIAVHAGELDR